MKGTGELRAVKRLSKEGWKKMGRNAERELTHLISVMDQPDLFVQFLGWYESDDFVFYAMEYLKDGDLDQYIKGNPQRACQNAQEISKQLLQGLMVLHEKKICHRDLKPQNVLIASLYPIRVKLADFGISKCEASSMMVTSWVGTMGYIAPEVMRILPPGSPVQRQYSNAVDMWAFGCIVHLLLTGEQVFTSGGYFDMRAFMGFCGGQRGLVEAIFVAQTEDTCALDFVRRLLVHEGGQRMSASQALSHKWITSATPPDIVTHTRPTRRLIVCSRLSARRPYTASSPDLPTASFSSLRTPQQHNWRDYLNASISRTSMREGKRVHLRVPSPAQNIAEGDTHSTRFGTWIRRFRGVVTLLRLKLLPKAT